jgi:drug/metabolite transporter (DMT)-like permease
MKRKPHSGRSENAWLGGLLIVFGFLCIAIMCALVKAVTDVPTSTIILFQNSVGLLFIGPWILSRGTGEVKTSRLWLHTLRAGSGVMSQVLMFIALKKIPLMDAVLLGNSSPLFIPMVAWLALKEKIGGVVWVSLIAGFIGIIFILNPSPGSLCNGSALLAISAAGFSAVALVTVNCLSKTETAVGILIHYFLFSSLLALPFAVAGWRVLSDREWACLTGIGVLMAAAQVFIVLAYRYASAERIAPFNYSVVVFSGLIGWLAWKEVPGLLSGVGVLLVCAGGIITTRFGRPNSKGHFGWVGHWNLDVHPGRKLDGGVE